MKERPILFSAPMVRALLAGTKTQTRRLIADDWWRCLDPDDDDDRAQALGMCPYGVAGDRLWVRETHAFAPPGVQHTPEIFYRATHDREMPAKWRPSIFMPRAASRLTLSIISVRIERLQSISGDDALAEGITIPVTSERHPLLPISRPSFTQALPADYRLGDGLRASDLYRAHYADLWDSINDKRAPWSSNPWVWVITFAASGAT